MAVVLPLAGHPDVAQADETVVGELVQTWVDGDPAAPSEQAADGPVSWVQTDDGETVRVATEDVADVPVGSTVEAVLGAETAEGDSAIEPAREADVTVLDAAPAVTAPATPAAHDVTVVAVATEGYHPIVPDLSWMNAVVTAVNGPVRNYWSTETDGAIQLTATSWPTMVVAAASCADPYALWDEVADAVGFVPGPRKHLLLHISLSGPGNLSPCDYAQAEWGADRDSGGLIWVQGTAPALIAHQFGHNFGLADSGRSTCGNDTTCGVYLDDDWYDLMGSDYGPMGSLNVAQANLIGLLPDPAVQVVTTWGSKVGRTYTLQPLGGRTGVRALKIIDHEEVYWLEYRTAVGNDAWLATPSNTQGLQTGVLAHITSDFVGTSALLKASTVMGDASHVALPVGKTFWIGGTHVTIESATAAGATLRIAASGMANYPGGDRDCGRRPMVPTTGVAALMTDTTAGAFVTGLDRGLWYRPLDGASNSWQSLGGGLHYGPAAVAAGSTSYVFVTGITGELWYRANSGGGWGPWTSLGGYLTASPAAASLGDGHVRVFGRGMQGELWSREFSGSSWSGWTAHGGYLAGPPTATARPEEETTQVYVRGSDGYTYRQTLPVGSGAQPYERLDFMSCTAVAMDTVSADSDIALGAWVDSSGTPRLLDSSGAYAAQWLGGVITSTPAVAFGEHEFVFVGRGLDNALWLYDGRAGGSGWRSLGGYVL